MPNHRLRMGLVGYGLFGHHHARLIATGNNTSLAGIAVPSAESQRRAREQFSNLPVTENVTDLLRRPDVDAVSIVVPNHLHFAMARDAILANKHVLLEKPMAMSVEHCRELIELAHARQRVIAIGHELRLSALWGRIKQLIEQGLIGTPQYAMVELSRFPYRMGSNGWRYSAERVGNWILEEPIHFFDLVRWYLSEQGEPQTIYARGQSRDPNRRELHDHFSAIINFANGSYGIVTQTLAAFGHHQTAKVAGTEGTIWGRWSASDARSDRPAFSLQYGLGSTVHDIRFEATTGELVELAQEIEAFADAVQTGASPPCSGIDGLWSTKLCLAALDSIQSGSLVVL